MTQVFHSDPDTHEHYHVNKYKTPKSNTICDGCGLSTDNFKVRPWRKSFVHAELNLCPKCYKKCAESEGETVKEVYNGLAAVGMAPLPDAPKRVRKTKKPVKRAKQSKKIAKQKGKRK